MIAQALKLIYAGLAYILATLALLYIMGFLVDVVVPKGISDGDPGPLWISVAVDTGLVWLFGLHHSLTARASFKKWWTKTVPEDIERATYLYMTVLMIGMLVHFWIPIPVTVWQFEPGAATLVVYSLYVSVWMMMSFATFQFGHFHFFGLAQVWQKLRGLDPARGQMAERYLYSLVRHPISVGWMTVPFLVPQFTVSHLVFALATVVYILCATPFEEADLLEEIGEPYRSYCKRVSRFLPFNVK